MVCRAGKNHEGRIWVTTIGKTLQKERQCAQHRVWNKLFKCHSELSSNSLRGFKNYLVQLFLKNKDLPNNGTQKE